MRFLHILLICFLSISSQHIHAQPNNSDDGEWSFSAALNDARAELEGLKPPNPIRLAENQRVADQLRTFVTGAGQGVAIPQIIDTTTRAIQGSQNGASQSGDLKITYILADPLSALARENAEKMAEAGVIQQPLPNGSGVRAGDGSVIPQAVLDSMAAQAQASRSGVKVATGDVNGDGDGGGFATPSQAVLDSIAAQQAQAAARVQPQTPPSPSQAVLDSIAAQRTAGFGGGVNVAAGDLNAVPVPPSIPTASAGGVASTLKIDEQGNNIPSDTTIPTDPQSIKASPAKPDGNIPITVNGVVFIPIKGSSRNTAIDGSVPITVNGIKFNPDKSTPTETAGLSVTSSLMINEQGNNVPAATTIVSAPQPIKPSPDFATVVAPKTETPPATLAAPVTPAIVGLMEMDSSTEAELDELMAAHHTENNYIDNNKQNNNNNNNNKDKQPYDRITIVTFVPKPSGLRRLRPQPEAQPRRPGMESSLQFINALYQHVSKGGHLTKGLSRVQREQLTWWCDKHAVPCPRCPHVVHDYITPMLVESSSSSSSAIETVTATSADGIVDSVNGQVNPMVSALCPRLCVCPGVNGVPWYVRASATVPGLPPLKPVATTLLEQGAHVETEGEGEGEADTETETETTDMAEQQDQAVTDADASTDATAESEQSSNVASEAEAGTEAEAAIETETETETETQAETETEASADAQVEVAAETQQTAGVQAEASASADVAAGVDSDAELDAVMEAADRRVHVFGHLDHANHHTQPIWG